MFPSRPPRAFLAAAALVLLLPLAGATSHETASPDPGTQDVQARPLHVLAYHPYPDTQGGGEDPFGIPGGVRNGTTVGYMEAQYDAYWYPTTVIDGVDVIEGGPKDSSVLFDRYAESFEERRELDSPVRVSMMGAIDEASRNASYQVALSLKSGVAATSFELRLVLYEDEIPFEGSNGVDVHRFTVRAIVRNETFPLTPAGPTNVVGSIQIGDWNTERLGLVASLHNRDASSARYEQDEVVQAATFRYGQAGPTIQYSKGVLLETLTATWCPACVHGDAVVDDMANEWGVPSSTYLAGGWAYLRGLDAGKIMIAVLAAGVAALAAWTLQRKGASPP